MTPIEQLQEQLSQPNETIPGQHTCCCLAVLLVRVECDTAQLTLAQHCPLVLQQLCPAAVSMCPRLQHCEGRGCDQNMQYS
jgi:hypothetical protein